MSDDSRKRIEDALARLEAGLSGLAGTLGNTLSEVIDRLDQHERTDDRGEAEGHFGAGPIRADAGLRVRFAGQEQASRAFRQTSEAGRGPVPYRSRSPRSRSSEDGRPPPSDPVERGRQSEPGTVEEKGNASLAFGAVHLEGHADDTHWIVLGEVPGAAASEIALHLRGDGSRRLLCLETTGPRLYLAELPVPADVKGDTVEYALQNGILQVSVPLAAQGEQG